MNSALWEKPGFLQIFCCPENTAIAIGKYFLQIFCVQENAAENSALVKRVDKIVGTCTNHDKSAEKIQQTLCSKRIFVYFCPLLKLGSFG